MAKMKQAALLFTTALPCLALLSACQTMDGAGEQDHGEAYRAGGNEPGWVLNMGDFSIEYEGDYGATKISATKPEGKPSFNGMRYVTPKITVDITYAPCSDDADRRYADSVTVTTAKGTVKGCGGKLLPASNLAGTKWQLLSLNDVKVDDPAKTEITFDGKRMGATTGCNRMSGNYVVGGNVINFGPVIGTKMACMEGQSMQLESQFQAFLATAVKHRFTPGGEWLLYNDKGDRALLRQVG